MGALPKKAAVKMSDHLFRIYDKDNNGKIDFVELMAVYQIMAKGSPEQVLNQIFLAFDTNRDGYINPKEMIATNAFKEMDKNANGKITADEFVTACMAQDSFSKLLAIKIMDIFVDDE